MKYLVLIFSVLISINLCAQNEEESFFKSSIWQEGDTLVNFNRIHNNSVKTVEISTEVRLPDFLTFTQDGILIFEKSVNKIDKKISFELKTTTLDGEVYINVVSIYTNRNQIPIVIVNTDKIDMATGWRADGKIYVVVAVSLVLFLFLAIYLAIIDRKVSKFDN